MKEDTEQESYSAVSVPGRRMPFRAFSGGNHMNNFLSSVKENLAFLLVCLLTFAGLFLIAWLIERFLLKSRRNVSGARYICYVAVFSALAGALMFLEIPLFFAPSFYKLDLSEIPVLICTFFLGPVAGVVSEFLKVLIKLLFKGTTTAFVGDFANFAVGCSMVLPASIVYHIRKTRSTAILGMATGTVCLTVFGSLFNAVYLLPRFAALFGMPMDAIIGMGTAVNAHITSVSTLVLFAVVPFNLLKGIVVSLITFLLYKRVEKLLIRERSGI